MLRSNCRIEVTNCCGWLPVAIAALMFTTGCNDNPTDSPSEPLVTLQAVPGEVINTDVYPDNLHLVTDVILTAGQSNASAHGSKFQPDLFPAKDRLDSRILVWTQYDGWKIANPQNQIWEHDRFPARLWDPVNSNNSCVYTDLNTGSVYSLLATR